MIRILAPHFVAGVIVGQRTAPILTFMRTWSAERIAAYCRAKGWRWERCPPDYEIAQLPDGLVGE